MDALTALLSEVRAEGALFGRSYLTPPWSVRFTEGPGLTMVVMLRRSGWVVPDDGPPVAVGEGEVAVVTGSAPFTVTDDPGARTPPTYLAHGDGRCTTGDGRDIGDDLRLGARTCGPDLDAPAAVLTGGFQVRGRVSARLLHALPRVLVVPHEGELCAVLDLTTAEIERTEPGQQAVLDRLLDLLLLTTLRTWFAQPGADPPAWYRAFGDPVVGPVLRALHAAPARPWTVAALATEAGVSRATLARRFTELVGEPPMAYLTGWRLSLAADLLARTDATVDAVAHQVGYGSAFGLSVAFQRVHGTRPSRLRVAAELAPADR
ncbi:AraC family transcriptional regulator [Pseudonocardia humida]|uniref:AraC family transcriptional regulator n=1 Tax=Pseudonocardia humida TaxID=2800819 RepID=A0ABT1A9G9_9PSEU|nr:AraC family transcriptional regulator [Pseudonocardia humida]MCO1659648.1 AraC family transcriptional regulator [Pseudonocardia humida]